ncbi:hypothetical protein LH464_04385 [Neorhizobium sp. T786]|uniref:hypothetical protein n=1 Tax=Pseudorhizobium xiangyangii TaxID=2883104 RepID=UPI001CFF697F|nr:hypothetical protein [Neorhizobium xiangyangii]MCB5201716.1 hypothetical protein [Neorhizobium xiangyangii]
MDWDELLDDMTAVVVDTFAVSLVYERAEAPGVLIDKTPSGAPLTCIYDVETVDGAEGGSLSVANRRTIIDVRLDDLGFVPSTKDFVRVPAGRFSILNKDESSSGMMKLQLRKV